MSKEAYDFVTMVLDGISKDNFLSLNALDPNDTDKLKGKGTRFWQSAKPRLDYIPLGIWDKYKLSPYKVRSLCHKHFGISSHEFHISYQRRDNDDVEYYLLRKNSDISPDVVSRWSEIYRPAKSYLNQEEESSFRGDMDGYVLCMPGTSDEIDRRIAMGFSPNQILAVEHDKIIWQKLCEDLEKRSPRNTPTQPHFGDVSELIQSYSGYSLVNLDYMSMIKLKEIRDIDLLCGRLQDNARIRVTYSLNERNISRLEEFYAWFLDRYAKKLFSLVGMDSSLLDTASTYDLHILAPSVCIWTTLIINHTLGLSLSEFDARNTLPQIDVGYMISQVQIRPYRDKSSMETSWFDLTIISNPLLKFKHCSFELLVKTYEAYSIKSNEV